MAALLAHGVTPFACDSVGNSVWLHYLQAPPFSDNPLIKVQVQRIEASLHLSAVKPRRAHVQAGDEGHYGMSFSDYKATDVPLASYHAFKRVFLQHLHASNDAACVRLLSAGAHHAAALASDSVECHVDVDAEAGGATQPLPTAPLLCAVAAADLPSTLRSLIEVRWGALEWLEVGTAAGHTIARRLQAIHDDQGRELLALAGPGCKLVLAERMAVVSVRDDGDSDDDNDNESVDDQAGASLARPSSEATTSSWLSLRTPSVSNGSLASPTTPCDAAALSCAHLPGALRSPRQQVSSGEVPTKQQGGSLSPKYGDADLGDDADSLFDGADVEAILTF